MTKKKFLVSMVILMAVVSVFMFSSCNLKDLGKPESEYGEKRITVIIGDEEFSVNTSEEYLHQVLITLSAENRFEYLYSDMGYGISVMQVKNIKTALDWTSWVSIYHDINDVTLVDNYGIFKYKEKDYFMSLVNINMLPVLNGHTYLFEQGGLS